MLQLMQELVQDRKQREKESAEQRELLCRVPEA